MEQYFNKLMENMRIQKEHNLIDTIIDIYNGVYKDYDEYIKETRKLNDNFIPTDYLIVLAPEVFEYIRSKIKE